MNSAPPTLPGEKWLPVSNWESRYMVSDFGRVYSIPRFNARGGILRQAYNETRRFDYPRVFLCRPQDNGGYFVKTIRVHRLVARAFLGPIPHGLDVCHTNGNRRDNHGVELPRGVDGALSTHNTAISARRWDLRASLRTADAGPRPAGPPIGGSGICIIFTSCNLGIHKAARRRGSVGARQGEPLSGLVVANGGTQKAGNRLDFKGSRVGNPARAAKTSPDPQSGISRNTVVRSKSSCSCSTGRISPRDTVHPTPEFSALDQGLTISPNPAGKDRDAVLCCTIPVALGLLPHKNRGDGDLKRREA